MLSGSIPSELGTLPNLTLFFLLDGNQLENAVPQEVCDLNAIVMSLDYNKLDIYNSPAECDASFPDWYRTQTVPPSGVSIASLDTSTVQGTMAVNADVRLEWTPIAYMGNGGNYEVFTRNLVNDEIVSRGQTADKTAASINITISGDPMGFAYFVRTNSNSHASNQSALTSVDGEEVFLETVAVRMLDIAANVPLLYAPALALLAVLLLAAATALAVTFSRKR
jgi:hypothetical protein